MTVVLNFKKMECIIEEVTITDLVAGVSLRGKVYSDKNENTYEVCEWSGRTYYRQAELGEEGELIFKDWKILALMD